MTTVTETPKQDRLPWYDFSKLWSFNGYYNMVLGSRGTGKTFGAKLKGIKDAINKGDEFIYLRRYKDELKFSRDGFFSDIVAEEKFPNYDFKVDGNKGYYAPTYTQDWKKRPWKVCVHFFALSVGGQIKSQSFPDVKLIIYDEFVIEKGNVQYLPNEAKKFNDFYSTVDRYKGKTRALFLSNSVSIMNPFFLAWDIEPRHDEDWMILKNGFIVVHFHKSDEFNNAVYATPFGQFIQGTDYAEYAVGNQFRDNNDLMLGDKPPEARYRWTLETINGGSMSLWYDRQNYCWYAQRKRPRSEDIYTMDPAEVSPDKTLLISSDRHLTLIQTAFRHGRLLFDAAQTRNAFREIL